nr:MAG TPA: brinker DNA-binding domain protein [Caudoviricetes sp.]
MAARLTDRQKMKILADYLENGSYRATARKNNVNASTVKRIVEASGDFKQKAAQKKEKDAADVLAYMDSQKDLVCQIIQKGLEALNDPDKLAQASPSQITTAIGTLIDKWTMVVKAENKGESGVVLMPEVGEDG